MQGEGFVFFVQGVELACCACCPFNPRMSQRTRAILALICSSRLLGMAKGRGAEGDGKAGIQDHEENSQMHQ